ncbi:MFS transporter [Neorhodopirellula pilleata]|uniref:Lysophospholipid transporter LplT n=1 Tax=Neorhodopirellula pilleata TaxID=2714738 RepID=A0A5C6ARC2_9BACT|nr:MFS transporter [Neorhodopirellula pilleata]TWU01542.1 Lysophospholipid transporter LplT [Neorhodopirellula pilleata]
MAPTQPAPIDRLSHRAFLGFLGTQFFGAFNDNLFKQLLLLLAVPTAVVAVAGEEPAKAADLQGLATMLFGLPFVIFGGLAGYMADRYSKRSIIVGSKVAEIAIMAAGLVAFLATPLIGFTGLWIVLFLMGLQSTFFGPGKYGILPEMLPREQLGRANGLVMMTTFIAIIIGTALAGPLKDAVVSPDLPREQAAAGLWIGSLVCIGIAVIGTIASLFIARLPSAEPTLKLKPENLAVPKEIRTLLRRDKPLMLALLASCIFWLIAGLTIQAVNSLGKVQLGLSDTVTSLMVSLISVGIAAGGLIAGQISRRVSDNAVVQIGMWATVVLCFVFSITLPGGQHLLGFYGSIPVLILTGGAAAFFAIPIQVFLQSRPPEAYKGRMIAVMNQANFFAIVMSGAVYFALDRLIIAADWPRSAVFAAMGLLFLPVAIFYRLDDAPLPEHS